MKFFQADSKIKVLSVIYFMVAQSSMMARATSDSFLLKYFQAESIPLMIMGAASLSIILALLSTYLCERFQAYGAMRIATAGIVITLISLVPIVFLFGELGQTKPIYVFAYMLCETIVILPMVLFWGMAMGFAVNVGMNALSLTGLVEWPVMADPILVGVVCSYIAVALVSRRGSVTATESSYQAGLHFMPSVERDPATVRQTLLWPKVMVTMGALIAALLTLFYALPYQQAVASAVPNLAGLLP